MKANRTKEKLILFGTLAILLLLVALFAEQICPYDPYAQDLTQAMQAPNREHLMGTDTYGRDMLSRVITGARTSIFSTLLLVSMITIFGTTMGVLCGYYGGVIDVMIMRISDVCLAFPSLIFAMAVASVLNGGLQNAILSLAFISWPKYSRIARSQTLSTKNLAYIQAAKLAGDTGLQIIFRHILPNIIGSILTASMLDIGTMMMELAGLSFLGLGAQPPTAEWGNMMSNGRSMLQTYPWVILSPGIAIFISVVIFNLLGDTIRDYIDPKHIS